MQMASFVPFVSWKSLNAAALSAVKGGKAIAWNARRVSALVRRTEAALQNKLRKNHLFPPFPNGPLWKKERGCCTGRFPSKIYLKGRLVFQGLMRPLLVVVLDKFANPCAGLFYCFIRTEINVLIF